ncbi:MAG: diphthine--ammonia ligase [Dehalococcoidia bacterium]|nr:MAG: diphthine--ammonia ligase [Dehalococcoidia bacterium]
MKLAFGSWSGGKDCCMACFKAFSDGLKVSFLVNMITEDGERSRSHGLAAKWLQMQAQAMNIPIVQHSATRDNYEAEFKKVLVDLRQKGVTEGVFGDIDVQEHRVWIERVCSEMGFTPHFPLWLVDQKQIVTDFINLGFESVIVAVKADLMGEEWLGRKLDKGFLMDLAKLNNITPCGENGEFHTLVIDGPLFEKRMEIIEANKVLSEGRWFWEITKCQLSPKK